MHEYSNEEMQEFWDRFVKNGKQSDFKTIYDHYWMRMYKVSLSILKDKSLAEDVVQDIFTMLWNKRDGDAQSIYQIGHYLMRSTKLKVFQYLRNSKTRNEHLKRMDKLLLVNTVEETVAFNETSLILEQCIGRLPAKCRRVFTLSRIENKSNQEIAEIMEISNKTVEGHITTALKALRNEFTAYVKTS
ncbi:hypothetical protein DN752_19400 [Echinicola strongylocentroti]|uniref:RNA polymerase sigma factor 70 region 4 type 2 domain-containing protein n=1 Tax=Echinicola strongylocentroti TaxID=1795355 RepID=A0A2Z4IN23_9BACT|nr:RNA polymerase sigma-70 factor [Echinicola strongylocentroti]AWW32129.1 hypothetical protein DN752_19400 [Echinicola strongylocentroti]